MRHQTSKGFYGLRLYLLTSTGRKTEAFVSLFVNIVHKLKTEGRLKYFLQD
jgi:hypothetical protein